MQLSVIILNYNVRYFLEACVLSVQKAIQSLDAEIIVVDNNSSDDSCQMMKTRFPNIKLIANQQNVGFPKGNNIGVKNASGTYICILNPDTIVAEDTFIKILYFLQHNDNHVDTGIVGCQLIDGRGNFLPESKRGVPTPWVAFTKIFGLYKIFPKSKLFNRYYAQHLNENQTGKVDVLAGAFMFLKRNLYIEIGGFDENCFMYSDDIDLSYLALKKNKNNYYFHETTIIHYKGESTMKDGQYMKRFQEAMHFFYKKHFKVSLFFTLFMKIGIVTFSIIKMFQGKFKPNTKPDKYLIISNNNILKKKVEKKIQKNKSLFSLENVKVVLSQSMSTHVKTELILDLNSMSFKEAISVLQQKKNKNVTFKLFPPKSNYLIGSNSSSDRGEVVIF